MTLTEDIYLDFLAVRQNKEEWPKAERFAEKTHGELLIGTNGKPRVQYMVKNEDGYTLKSTAAFGDFSSFSNFGETLSGFDNATNGSDDGANYGGTYGGMDGMRKLSEDSNKIAKKTKHNASGLAAASTITLQPEGVAASEVLYGGGEVLDSISTGFGIYVDLYESFNAKTERERKDKANDAATRATAYALDFLMGKAVNSLSPDSTTQIILNTATSDAVDNQKDEIINNNNGL